MGRIDILVNAAGMGNNKMVTDQSNEEWERHIHIDLSGVYYMCKAVGEIMIEQEYGKIINIGLSRKCCVGRVCLCLRRVAQ